MANLNIDTDLVRDLKSIRQELAELCVESDDGCLLFPHAGIQARVQGYDHRIRISPARIAWALAHPETHLGVHDLAVHICSFGTKAGGSDDPRCCCNPDHIIKGTRDDVVVMTRARHLVLQGAK